MPYDSHCETCPYLNQSHLKNTAYFNSSRPIGHSPIDLENNSSNVLLVFQAPGVEEWPVGQAIQPVKKPGGSAGSRLEQSWNRKHKKRTDFDIVNTVQCFPGNPGTPGARDYEPVPSAVSCCSGRLAVAMSSKSYSEIIAFGKFAQDQVNKIVPGLNYTPKVTPARHPTGGCSSSDLDKLW